MPSSSNSEEAELAVATRQLLHQELSAMDEAELRRLVATLVDNNPAVEAALKKSLFGLDSSAPPKKSWEICARCDETYDANEPRSATECEYHDGEPKVVPFRPI